MPAPLPLSAGAGTLPGVFGMPAQSQNMGSPIPPGPMGPPPIPPNLSDPANMQYSNETQQDGSILIRVKNPDGTLGPVVQIVPPPKMHGAKKK